VLIIKKMGRQKICSMCQQWVFTKEHNKNKGSR